MKIFNDAKINLNYSFNFKGKTKENKKEQTGNSQINDSTYRVYSKGITAQNASMISFKGSESITEANKEKILFLRDAGLTHSEIASEFGCSRQAITGALKKWDAKTSKEISRLVARKPEITRLYIQDYPIKSIAEEFNCEEEQLKKLISSWKIHKIENEDFIKQNKEMLIFLFDYGFTCSQIAKGLGLEKDEVASALNNWGVDTSNFAALKNNKENVIFMHKCGYSNQQIADRYDCEAKDVANSFTLWDIK